MHFQVCLKLYPTICKESDSTFTVAHCILTSPPQVVAVNTVTPLTTQYYDLTSTTAFSYPLGLMQLSPKCYISGSLGWAVAQGPVVTTGSNPGGFLTIDATTGVYSIATGSNLNDWGTYTILISSVTFQGVTYNGASPSTTLDAPSSFILYAHKGCYGSIVTGYTISPITLKAEDPIAYYPSGGFSAFTDSVSTAKSDPLYCEKTYQVTISPTNTLTTFIFDATTRSFQIFSNQPSQVRTYTVTVKGYLTQFPTGSSSTQTFSITVNLPSCTSTVLNMPSTVPVFADMTTSVLIQALQTPTYGTFTDTVNAKYTTVNCGARNFKINSVVLSASTALSTDLSVTSVTTGQIKILPTANSEVGTHTATVTVFLALYPTVTKDLSPFQITVNPCAVTAVAVVRANQVYKLSTSNTLAYQLTVSQTPACNYPQTGWSIVTTGGPSPLSFQTITDGGLYQVGPIPSALNFAGTYTITITGVVINGQSYTQTQLAAAFNLVVTDPCATTTVTAVSQGTISIAVWDPLKTVAINIFTDSASTTDGNANFCVKSYTLALTSSSNGQTPTSYGIDASGTNFQFSSQTFNQIGSYVFTLTGSVVLYTTRSSSTTFTLQVTDPCLTTVLSATALQNMQTSVLVQTASGTPSFETQILTGIQDSLSVSQGSQVCGNYKYSISSVPTAPALSLSSTELAFGPSTSVINVFTALSSKVGTHTATVTLGLVNYAGVTMPLSTFTITILQCIVTAIKLVDSTNQSPVAQSYTLSSTLKLNYQLTAVLTPACGYPITAWVASATGPATANFTNISPTGLYSVGPTTSPNQVGTYTINIDSVTFNSITFSQITSPSGFALSVLSPCGTTLITAPTLAAISLTVWDLSQAYPAFPEFTDSIATLNGDPTMCPKTYTATISTNAGGKSLTLFILDSSVRQFTISSQSYDQIGTYTVTLVAIVTSFPSQTKSSSFTVTVIDPCLSTTLIAPTPLPSDMSTSIKVQQADGSPLFIQPSMFSFFDSVSAAHGTGTDVCGQRVYSISSIVLALASAALSMTELTIDASSGLISIWSSNNQVIGTHTATIVAKLTSYPSKASPLVTFMIQIFPCIVQSFTMASLPKVTYIIADPLLVWSLVGTSITTQVPACGYSVDLVQSGEPSTFVSVSSGSTLTYQAQTRDLTLAGTSVISVTATLISYILGAGQTVQPLCSINYDFEAANPCLTTKISLVPSVIESLVIFPGQSIKSLQKYNYNDTASFAYTLPTDPIDFCGEKLLTFSLESAATTLIKEKNDDFVFMSLPKDATNFGRKKATALVTMKLYPDVVSNLIEFEVTILLPAVPKIPHMEFTVGESIAQFVYDSFVINPIDYNTGESSVQAYVYTGSSLPSKIDVAVFNDLRVASDFEWIHINYDFNKLSIFTTVGAYAGQYTVVLVQSLKNFPDVYPFTHFKVTIHPEKVDLPAKRSPPYFYPALRSLTVTQCPDPKTKVWSYTLPEIIDPQNSPVNIQVLMESAFFLYDDPTRTVSQIKVAEQPSNHTIKVILIDKLGLKSLNQMQVQFVCETTERFLFNFTLKEVQDQLAKQTYKPTASIAKIDQSGLLHIQFGQRMKIPDKPEYLKSENIIFDGVLYPMLQITILPGKQSERTLLKFKWTLVEYQPSQLLIQLDFENQNYISSRNTDRDSIQITMFGYQLFADRLGNFMLPKSDFGTKQLPQMTSVQKIAQAQSIADTASNAMNVGMLTNTIVMFVVAGPMQQLLGSVKQLQIIVHIMLINVAYPVVTTVYMGMFMKVLTFQFYDFGPLYDWLLRLDPDSAGNKPLNDQFDLMGYSDLYIIKNFGTLCWTIFVGPLVFFIFQTLVKLKWAKFEAKKIFWGKMMRYNYWIALLNETYLFLAVCCGLNLLYYRKWSGVGDTINSLISVFFSAFVLLLPVFVAVWYGYSKNYNRIMDRDQDFLARFGAAIEGLNFKRVEKVKVLLFLTVSILRKLWLAHIVVFQQDYAVMSIFQINFQSILMLIVSGFTEPITDIAGGRMNLINEGFVFIITYHLYLFTNFMTDLAARDWTGQSMVIVTFLNVILNIAVIAFQSIFHLGRKAKLKWMALKQSRAIEKQLKRKQANQRASQNMREAQNQLEMQRLQSQNISYLNMPIKGCLKRPSFPDLSLKSNALAPLQNNSEGIASKNSSPIFKHSQQPQQLDQTPSPVYVTVKTKKPGALFNLKQQISRNRNHHASNHQVKNITLLDDVLNNNPTAQVEVFKSFVSRQTQNLIEVKQVGDAGLLLRISLVVNGIEAHFYPVTIFDTPQMISQKRNDLVLYAEFMSLDKPKNIWEEIKSGSFDRYLESYQIQKLYYEEHYDPDSTFLDVGDYGPQQSLEYRIELYQTLKRHDQQLAQAAHISRNPQLRNLDPTAHRHVEYR